jgi:hypothetical protein
MLTLLLSLLIMGGVWVGLQYGIQMGHGWSVVIAVTVGIGGYIGTMLLLRRKVGALMTGVQNRITSRNTILMRKYQQLGSRGGDPKRLMDQARREQESILSEALEATRQLDPYCKWSPLLDRQINSIRIQFLYQLKKFDEVDRLLPKALLTEPVLVCMKMCRQYQHGAEADLEKTYNKYRKKFKLDAAIIYATYAWMLLKKKQGDKARQVLLDGKTATENDLLEKNWEHLSNDKPNHFSNAGFGETWYALYLEEPKQPKPRVERRLRRW